MLKQDVLREREMLRYFTPETEASNSQDPGASHTIASPNKALTAFAQLCALRLQAQRSMISLIGKQQQYIIAEATPSMNIADTSKSEKEGDNLWLGCDTVDKSAGLCQNTLGATTVQGGFPMFTVPNLLEDSRFSDLPYVKDGPRFRFYAGTPITTKRGINIGSLCVLDSDQRPSLSESQVEVFGTLATTIMDHLESKAEARERSKVQRMSLGINAFVEGRNHLVMQHMHDAAGDRWATGEGTSKDASRRRSKRAGSSHIKRDSGPGRKESLISSFREDTISESSHDESDREPDGQQPVATGYHSTLTRAGNILYEALDIRGKGGVVFFDSTTKRRHMTDVSSRVRSTDKSAPPSSFSALVLSSNTDVSGMDPAGSGSTKFEPIDDDLLHTLLRRYPKGKLWTLDGDVGSSSEEETLRYPDDVDTASSNRKGDEKVVLRKLFPGVNQLLFYGLWDAGSSRWFTACCVWTTSTHPFFTVETELNYLMTFGNSVMAQVSRLASMEADRQKTDFIGSISHELRSPLHGILASAEFLSEVVDDTFQVGLIDTISSCGRTLLDTINHIFDYSKINSFERTWKHSKPFKRKHRIAAKRTNYNKDVPPTLNIYAGVDVASLVEEVVEGVYAGQVYQDISSTDTPGFSIARKAEAQERGIMMSTESGRKAMKKEVEVVMDLAPGDYNFVTQPGALKRLVMNVFGNALKYTQRGTIKVSLSFEDPGNLHDDQVSIADPESEKLLRIRVTDTGKGISREYLRTSLFNPFSQEDVLASGTGLGLSIVRSIVTMLQGAIDVQSEVGVGTEVTIWLPMSQPAGSVSNMSTPSSVASGAIEDPIHALKDDHCGSAVALVGFDNDETGQDAILRQYVRDWFDLQIIEDTREADVLIIEERALNTLPSTSSRTVPIVALCKSTTRNQTAGRGYESKFMEFVSKPCGVRKLAKALRLSLEKAQNNITATPTPNETPMMDVSAEHGDVLPTQQLNNLVLEQADRDGPIEIQANEKMAAAMSTNALLAIDNPSAQLADKSTRTQDAEEYPFPISEGALSPHDEKSRPQDTNKSRSDVTTKGNASPQNGLSSGQSMTKVDATMTQYPTIGAAYPSAETTATDPHILLVDDNKINLRLLETFMKKRKYRNIDTAEDGKLAVEAVEARTTKYDIIFMDISMPVMNGFEATRKIRDLESARTRESHTPTSNLLSDPDRKSSTPISPNSDPPEAEPSSPATSALIIALTGLASGRDQAEAFASGVDLFLTKPVSFKEVGKLLDNWERHGGIQGREKTTPLSER